MKISSKLIAMGIPLLLLFYVFYLIVFNVAQTYTIDVGTRGDVVPSGDAYLSDPTEQDRLSLRMSIEDDTFRNMTGSPVYFYITPANRISNDARILVELRFKGDSDLDIAAHKNYLWNPLYIKKLDNYTPVKHFDDIIVYAKDNNSNLTDYNNIDEWISGNIPRYSAIELHGYDIDPSILMNRDITYNNTETEIIQTFRGTHSFLIYIKDTLNLTLCKQDGNCYNGSDEYSVELYDTDGSLFYNDTILDDGIVDDSRQEAPQLKTFFCDGIRECVYELRLVNKGSDSTITSIRINTDKIVTKEEILPLTPGTLYFDLKQNTTLKFYAWHSDAVQKIVIRGPVNKDVLINESLLEKCVHVELPGGSYTMSIKGDLFISGANFAFSEDSLFQPHNYKIGGENNQWVIIPNYQAETDSGGWITAKKIFRGSDLELYDNKTMVFSLEKKDESEVMLNEFKVTLTPR